MQSSNTVVLDDTDFAVCCDVVVVRDTQSECFTRPIYIIFSARIKSISKPKVLDDHHVDCNSACTAYSKLIVSELGRCQSDVR